ncbi:DUF2953 domain-containing protein [Clostridium oryzae]|uniref:DUF2953 domain-containing protein n=1 Tax=Clostridium oryzae TaxID=1450648 RepID=A0A1V4ITG5_9CLOT|nr:DUF2953 domain-containing protein [Clostridium oryzae]OPJ63183.1 hypothetical protein CLORY_12660 [Clostridium oryzae]
MIWVLIVLLAILLFPIRLKFTTVYENRMFRVYFFNKELNAKKKVMEEKANVRNYNIAHRKFYKIFKENFSTAIEKLSRNPHKIKAAVKFELRYGFEDAALTGIAYGLFNGINSFIYVYLRKLFNMKDYKFDIIPDFKNPQFNFRITSIIYFNLVKVIYILVILSRR